DEPRESFLPDAVRQFAYEHTPRPLDHGQTMSQPYIVARLAGPALFAPDDRALEIGAGSAYAGAAVRRLAAAGLRIARRAPPAGAEGWPEMESVMDGSPGPLPAPAGTARSIQPLPGLIGASAEPLPPFEDPDFGRALDCYADRRIILMGEASHGTSEFYRAC